MPSEKKIRVALVDDHPVFRDAVRRLLALEHDFEVVAEAADGHEAIDMLREHEPDILLLDLQMPELDGNGMLLRIRCDQLKTKIIVLTASDEEDQHVQAIQDGAAAIVRKDMATELLTDSIRKVHRGEIWLDANTTSALIRGYKRPVEARPQLSSRQREVVALVAQGLSNSRIGETLFVSERTVKNHLYRVSQKLGVSGRVEMARYGIEQAAILFLEDHRRHL